MIILGIGCNIGDRLLNLRQALAALSAISELQIQHVSPVYESEALLPENAAATWDKPYLNAAISCTTSLTPDELLIKVKAIEASMGRQAAGHWSPRVIDIDILAWDDKNIFTDRLHIPHEGLLERPFALLPLADVAPNWRYCLPETAETNKTAAELVKKWGSRFTGKAPLKTRQIAHRIDTPQMVGILNVTPDSFSDGGKFMDLDKALQQMHELFNAGADVIDIGAESTRPVGAVALTPKMEQERLQPILEVISSLWPQEVFRPKISVDTRHAQTAEFALKYNIDFLNDVSGFTDAEMQRIALNSQVKLIFMHNLGIPANPGMHLSEDDDCVTTIYQWGWEHLTKLLQLGISQERLVFDVGIGFGKTAAQSWDLLRKIACFKELNIPLLVGHSRKSFLSLITDKPFIDRDLETASISGYLARRNVDYLRVHNVDATLRLLKTQAYL